ncbi:MAG: HPr-rel-A system PqqD family peptide chaperone [Ruminococcaceae bacterium]|nr:HPr-rel-A system PqqD family peptide chaperone [Oscillospiraceae bacterium]
MNPYFKEDDVVSVEKANEYIPGDILVFIYKGTLLIHRLIKIENGRYFCKGDNAFRLEDMTLNDIGGKAILLNGKPIQPVPEWFIYLSYQINRIFRKSGFNVQKTKESGIYRFYYKIIWKNEDNTMIFKKNDNMDYIPADDTSLAIFDPESGDTHFLSESAIDILNCIEKPCDLDTLLNKLCEIYDAAHEDIKEDVKEFLAEMISKKVIIVE